MIAGLMRSRQASPRSPSFPTNQSLGIKGIEVRDHPPLDQLGALNSLPLLCPTAPCRTSSCACFSWLTFAPWLLYVVFFHHPLCKGWKLNCTCPKLSHACVAVLCPLNSGCSTPRFRPTAFFQLRAKTICLHHRILVLDLRSSIEQLESWLG